MKTILIISVGLALLLLLCALRQLHPTTGREGVRLADLPVPTSDTSVAIASPEPGPPSDRPIGGSAEPPNSSPQIPAAPPAPRVSATLRTGGPTGRSMPPEPPSAPKATNLNSPDQPMLNVGGERFALLRRAEVEVIEEITDGITTGTTSRTYWQLTEAAEKSAFILNLQQGGAQEVRSEMLLAIFRSEPDATLREELLTAASQLDYDANIEAMLLGALHPQEPLELRLAGLFHAVDAAPHLVRQFQFDPDSRIRDEVRGILDSLPTSPTGPGG